MTAALRACAPAAMVHEDGVCEDAVYEDTRHHVEDELRKLDLRLRLRIHELRLGNRGDPAAAAGVYIADHEVDRLLDRERTGAGEPALADLRRRLAELEGEVAARVEASLERGVSLGLPRLARLFALSPFELQALVVCLAPELDRKYDRLYAYLQDDITRRKPSVDLILQLLCDTPGERWRWRARLTPQALLLATGLLEEGDDPQSPSGTSDLARFLKLDPRILGYLLDDPALDPRVARLARLDPTLAAAGEAGIDPGLETRLFTLAERLLLDRAAPARMVVYLHGPYGAGRRRLASALCRRLGCRLLSLQTDLLLAEPDVEQTLRAVCREGLLLQAALYFDAAEPLVGDDPGGRVTARRLARVISEHGWLTFLAGDRGWSPEDLFAGADFYACELRVPGAARREAVWRRALSELPGDLDPAWARELGDRFRLTPGQIDDAAADLRREHLAGGSGRAPSLDDVYAACRRRSNHNLRRLAVKIVPRHGWQDLVIPDDRRRQLEELCGHLRHRHRVLGDWGFGRKLSRGTGSSALFAGPPGTGKTLAAEVVAGALGLDLYKVDLSAVVSKYIGETEKNLARIFREAETSNAILFFDEADALFGKRTEVRDAHDRYANIETSYLLQRIEEYEGVVILATNLRQNLDAAFSRRIAFVVELPFPDADSRRRIWRRHFPAAAPLAPDVDFERLAAELRIAGGNIKNVALAAAYLAAGDGGEITMEHILRGARREIEKMGRLWNDGGRARRKRA